MPTPEKKILSHEYIRRKDHITNPDTKSLPKDVFTLRPENTPPRLQHLFTSYQFRRCSTDEIINSEGLTQDAWPGIVPTNTHDLRTNNLINAPMCGVFTNDGKMVAYSRLLWGYDTQGNSELHSHMTAVSSDLRDGGVGEGLKWQARQIAQEFPKPSVNQISVTFDNQQGRIAHINLNKLGMVCGASGGVFRKNVYGELQGEQHRGNPTDRYQARWYLDSEWTHAHLDEYVRLFSVEETRMLPSAIQCEYVELKAPADYQVFPTPQSIDTNLETSYITLPLPLVWDNLLKADINYERIHINQWRRAHRAVLDTYHAKGYTTIMQSTDKDAGVNLQILAKDFDPYLPPKELLMA